MPDVKEAPRAQAQAAKTGNVTESEHRTPATAAATGESHPLAFMRRFADDMDRLFEEFGLRVPGFVGRGRELLRREAGLIPADWSPRIEILERDGRFLVHAELPGLSRDDIHVEVTGDLLTLKGERKQTKQEKREGYTYSERSYGSFHRSIPLPEGVDSSKATAEFRNGVLEVSMPAPKRPDTQPRRLEIHEKK